MNIDYTVQTWKEGNQFVAHAMPLDVMSSGLTQEKAQKALDEAVSLFLKTAADEDTLDEILEESGYQRINDEWIEPLWIGTEKHSAVIGI